MEYYKLKICPYGVEWKQYKSFDKCNCDDCKADREAKKKPVTNDAKKTYKIPRRSKKREAQETVYSKLRKVFLNRPENKICPIYGTPTTDVHHKKGREGLLLNDTRYWLAVSREGHEKIERNPAWAKEIGYSLSRLEKDGEEET